MEYILEVKGLEKMREGFVLHRMNVELRPGFLYGLAGKNGSGKTTLFDLLLGLNQPTHGRIKVCGYDLWRESEKAKQNIAYVLNDNPFSAGVSAMANAKIYGGCYDTFDFDKFIEYCKRFEIPLKKPLHKLSKGMNIKFQLAFALSYDAKLYLMDEPTEGLDPIFRREFKEILFDIIACGDKTILMSTQLTDELDEMADYLMVLDEGRLTVNESMEELHSQYILVKGTRTQIDYLNKDQVIGKRYREEEAEALVEKKDDPIRFNVSREIPTVADLLYYFQRTR